MGAGIDHETEAALDAKPNPVFIGRTRWWPTMHDRNRIKFWSSENENELKIRDAEKLIAYLQRYVSWAKRHAKKEPQIGDSP